MKSAVIIQVYGSVQGVGFRYFTKQTADKEGVCGFVKNKPDGSVYIEAEAETEVLDRFIQRVKKGPAWSRVKEVIVSESLPLQRLTFEIR